MDNFIVKGWLSKYRYGYLRSTDKPKSWGVLTPTGRFIKSREQYEGGALAEARVLKGTE